MLSSRPEIQFETESWRQEYLRHVAQIGLVKLILLLSLFGCYLNRCSSDIKLKSAGANSPSSGITQVDMQAPKAAL